MLAYLLDNPYIIIIGLLAAFIVSYNLVQKLNGEFNYQAIHSRKFYTRRAALAAAPFAVLLLLIFILTMI